jgi:alpha-mannosidase
MGHLDLAWLWPIRETIRKGARTFSTALALMDRYPDYVFGASQPQLYQWMKDRYPDLYARIRERVDQGRWEAQGASWVEGDVNLAGGESWVRQLLHGTRFFRDEFGVDARVAWLPDNFGFPASLPQVLKKSGVDYFLTIKLSWNTTTRFPRHSFIWQGLDGSEILAHMPPEGTYNSAALPHSVRSVETSYEHKDVSEHAMLLFGIGDGGGGPGEEHLERLARMANLEGLPPVRQERSSEFFARLQAESADLPTWEGELYLERHQGTYTTQGRTKRFNRKLEILLHDLEWISVLARALAGHPYPSEALDPIWKEALLYQFHDILPGTSIGRVYEETGVRYGILTREAEDLIGHAAKAIGDSIDGSSLARPVLVLNSLPWTRSQWVKLGDEWQFVSDVPSMGYALIDWKPRDATGKVLVARQDRLESDILRIDFGDDGRVVSVFDKQDQRQAINSSGGNRLIAYDDDGDAWDFPAAYRRGRQRQCVLESAAARIDGPTAILRQRYRLGESRVDQEIVLTAGSRTVEFRTQVDWQESHTMLRTAFPLGIRASEAACDIQFGVVERSTHRNTSWDQARDEICAHKWVDLSQLDYGVALLNDCKYGHRISGSTLDLSLLRSPTWPDPSADRGRHAFTYALYPHAGNHATGRVPQAAYELNVPLRTVELSRPPRGTRARSLSAFSVEGEGVMLETVKQAENGSDVVLRLYEWAGGAANVMVRSQLPVRQAWVSGLMERKPEPVAVAGNAVELRLNPFEIVTLGIGISME